MLTGPRVPYAVTALALLKLGIEPHPLILVSIEREKREERLRTDAALAAARVQYERETAPKSTRDVHGKKRGAPTKSIARGHLIVGDRLMDVRREAEQLGAERMV
jgi:hypothetical protein